MATRDRTGLFLRYREEARSLHRRPVPHDDPPLATADFAIDDNSPSAPSRLSPNGNGADSHATVVRTAMDPDWVFSYNELKEDITELDQMLEQLANLYAQHLLPSFGEKDTTYLERDIRLRSHRLTDLLHAVEQKVRAITKNPSSRKSRAANGAPSSATGDTGDFNTDDDAQARGDVERVIRRNLQRRFATPLQALSMSFRKRQKTYLDKLRQMRESYDDGDRNNAHGDQLVPVPLREGEEGGGGDGMGGDGHGVAFSDSQLQMVENSSALAEERRRELNRVASGVNDLATLVKDIAALVVDQGTVLDRVDYNLEDVRTKTMGATRELRIADRYQSKRHALCCIIILAAACGVMTIVLIYKWTS